MRKAIRLAHKYLGLALAIFWFMQAISGIILVYHR